MLAAVAQVRAGKRSSRDVSSTQKGDPSNLGTNATSGTFFSTRETATQRAGDYNEKSSFGPVRFSAGAVFCICARMPASAGEIAIPKPAVAQPDSRAEQVAYVRRAMWWCVEDRWACVEEWSCAEGRGRRLAWRSRGSSWGGGAPGAWWSVGGWHGARVVRPGGYWHGFRGYRTYHRGYRMYNGWWFPAGAFATGAIVGGAYGMTPPAYAINAHVQWCANRYRSYRAWDNTFQPLNGPRRQCVSPF